MTGFDYVHAIYHTQKLSADFSVWMAKLYWPEFKVVDELVYIAHNFDAEQYRVLVSGPVSPAERQYWMNLIEVTGILKICLFAKRLKWLNHLREAGMRN